MRGNEKGRKGGRERALFAWEGDKKKPRKKKNGKGQKEKNSPPFSAHSSLSLSPFLPSLSLPFSLPLALSLPSFATKHFNSIPGRAVLAAVEADGCQQTSLAIGDRLVAGLKKIQKGPNGEGGNSVVGDVRGSGLMLGIDLVSDSKTKEPNAAAAAAVAESLRRKGILIGKGGLRGNVLRVKPPMCWTRGDADFFLEAFEESLLEL